MFGVFERLIDPYPETIQPLPPRLSAFYATFIRPVWPLL